MKLLATIRPEDVDPNFVPEDYGAYKLRRVGRAIVLDGERVALLHVTKHGYYMLPGGGLDDGEDVAAGLQRELAEELGCEVEIGQEIGATEVYMDRWHKRQVDTCFVARVTRQQDSHTRTDFEKEEGHEVVWANNLAEAIRSVESAHPTNRDGKQVRARDVVFLKAAQRSLDGLC